MSGSSDRPAQSKYLWVRDQLIARLGSMEPGQPLPAERELAAELGVARMTLRKALAQLVAESLLFRRQGSGTFVARPKVAQRLTATSFSADMRARGLCPGARTLSAAMRPAGMAVGACLQIQPTATILRVRRLRLADGTPMALEELHVPGDVVPGLTGDDLVDHSFYVLLSQRYGLTLAGGTQTIEPTLTSAEDAALLDVAPGAPAFLFERTTKASTGRVVEFVRSVYRGDRYRIVVDLFPP
jgi:GntR family transcriptional regulator